MTSRAIPAEVSLVLSDVDGTLVTKDKRLTPAAQAAVKQLRKAKIRFAVASSRPPFGLATLGETLELDTLITAFNGGLIVAHDGAVLSRHFLPREVAKKAIEWLASAGVETWVFTPDQWLVTDVGAAYVAFEQRTINSAPSKVADFSQYLGAVGKIVGVSADFEFLARCEIELAKALGHSASVARSQSYYLDVTDPRANKAEALSFIAGYYGIPREKIVAIGDGLNDIGMLQWAAFGIAMGNGSDTVKAAADYVTASNEEDGFAAAMDHILQACRQSTGAPQ